MQNARPKLRRHVDGGYALLLAIFLTATMILLATAAVPPLLTEGHREMEEEMIWRGEQYARAVGLYYKKFGKYPTKVEDLTGLTNGVRFLRRAYTDPMNKEDGTWRFIYVGPNGQLIGSLKQVSLLQTVLTPSLNGPGIFSGGLQAPGPPPQGGITATGGGFGVGQGLGTNQGLGASTPQASEATSPTGFDAQPQPLSGNIIGGNIIGVGSKIDKASFHVYLGGDTYRKWEFIWNPVGLNALPGQAPANPNANPTSLPNPSSPTNPAPGQLAPFPPQQNPQPGPGGTPQPPPQQPQ